MASTSQKKTTTRTTAKKGGSSGSRTSAKKPQPRPVRREVGGVVCLVLALCVFVSYFGIRAIFIDWFAVLIKGLLGYGYWLFGPALGLGIADAQGQKQRGVELGGQPGRLGRAQAALVHHLAEQVGGVIHRPGGEHLLIQGHHLGVFVLFQREHPAEVPGKLIAGPVRELVQQKLFEGGGIPA